MNIVELEKLEIQFKQIGRSILAVTVTHSVDPSQVIPNDYLAMVVENDGDIVFQSRDYIDFIPFLQERIEGLTQLLKDAEHAIATRQGLWATDRPEVFSTNEYCELFELEDKELLDRIRKTIAVEQV